jgi:uncharacterized protein YjeT (DUF2065 family)
MPVPAPVSAAVPIQGAAAFSSIQGLPLTTEFLTAFALVLVLEGIAYALFPDFMRRMLALALMTPVGQLRVAGLVAAICGVGLVWLLRG